MKFDWPSYTIMGSLAAAMIWLFYCTATGTDPVGWFR